MTNNLFRQNKGCNHFHLFSNRTKMQLIRYMMHIIHLMHIDWTSIPPWNHFNEYVAISLWTNVSKSSRCFFTLRVIIARYLSIENNKSKRYWKILCMWMYWIWNWKVSQIYLFLCIYLKIIRKWMSDWEPMGTVRSCKCISSIKNVSSSIECEFWFPLIFLFRTHDVKFKTIYRPACVWVASLVDLWVDVILCKLIKTLLSNAGVCNTKCFNNFQRWTATGVLFDRSTTTRYKRLISSVIENFAFINSGLFCTAASCNLHDF